MKKKFLPTAWQNLLDIKSSGLIQNIFLEKAAVCKWDWLCWAVFISVNKGYG